MNPRSAFFDAIADKWDSWEDLNRLQRRMATGLARMRLHPDETVLDVGCGTGNLTLALLSALGPLGRVFAVDIAPRMIDVARGKVQDPRVTWHVGSAEALPFPAASIDRILCFSVWPHFHEKRTVLGELARLLRPSGYLHIWHLSPRDNINEIHAAAGDPVSGDLLPPASETAAQLTAAGYDVSETIDDAEQYLVTARTKGTETG